MTPLDKLKAAGARAYTDAEVDALAGDLAENMDTVCYPKSFVPGRLLVTLLEKRTPLPWPPPRLNEAGGHRYILASADGAWWLSQIDTAEMELGIIDFYIGPFDLPSTREPDAQG